MYTITALFVGLLAVVSVSGSSSNSLTSQTCSAPSSSIEVCLSSIFSSMEYYLSLVEVTLAKYEVSIHNNMHHEHTLLYSEISWVSAANKIAKQVKSAVQVDKAAIYEEVNDLNIELSNINSAYVEFNYVIGKISDAINANLLQIYNVQQEYNYIKTAKWQLYGYISAIAYEKNAVQIAINEVEKVVGQLNIQVTNIYNKISQLTKRQTWLLNWENKLYVDLEAFSKDVKQFRVVETDLVQRENNLYKEQTRLKKEVTQVRQAITNLRQEYQYIVDYINYLEIYENEVKSIYGSVSIDASQFISAYNEFTCEDNLLYYEACSSSVPAVVTPKPTPAKHTAVNKHAVVVTQRNVYTQKVTQRHVYTQKVTQKVAVTHYYTNKIAGTTKYGYKKTSTNNKNDANTNGNRKLLASGLSS